MKFEVPDSCHDAPSASVSVSVSRLYNLIKDSSVITSAVWIDMDGMYNDPLDGGDEKRFHESYMRFVNFRNRINEGAIYGLVIGCNEDGTEIHISDGRHRLAALQSLGIDQVRIFAEKKPESDERCDINLIQNLISAYSEYISPSK